MAAADTLPKLCLPVSPYRIDEKVRNGSPLTESLPLRSYRIPKVNSNRSVTWVDWPRNIRNGEVFARNFGTIAADCTMVTEYYFIKLRTIMIEHFLK
ncbi:hypothetical protein PanWU01x14_340570 [Parasponia andersonii]|uniref:Uncharacterized protein n=1 Tax=Parasponia andersonii TaxID=3476 RepID=A0A2P5AEF2_PARAD|nr:hypothetical protein PanWU01x14_340570 [Parasponia andersonii]